MSRNINIGTISYTGIVTISRYVGQKKIKLAQSHNNGGKALFNFLADCLLNDFTSARFERPTKIRLLTVTTDDNETKITPASAGFIHLQAQPEKIYDGVYGIGVRYSFVLPRGLIEGKSFNAIGLYAESEDDVNNYSAFCELPESRLGASSLFVLDWELTFSNGPTDKSDNTDTAV